MYSGASSALGAGSATAEQIDLWFAANGPSAATKYAPDKTYKPAPVGLGQMIIDACHRYGVVVNWDLIAGDIAKECAFWQSKIVRQKNNPSGLGATNDNPEGNAKHFDTPYEGILATVAHMLNYFLGEGEWTPDDPRTDALRNANWMGVAKKLSDLDGKWAWPGVGYGVSVASYGNRLLETPAGGGNIVTAQIGGFVWRPARDDHYTKGRGGVKIRGGAQHYSAGTNSLDWLTWSSGENPPNPKKRVSATFLIKHNPTLADRGWQLVRIEDTPWTTAFANDYTVSIEYEHKEGQSIPDIAYTVIAQTWLDVREYLRKNPHLGSIEISRDSIKGHKEWVNNPGLTCPDGVEVDRIVQRMRELDGAPMLPEEEKFPTGFTLIGAFLNLYRKAREADIHWRVIGVPIGPEIADVPVAYMQDDGSTKVIPSTVQRTDRGGGWLLWNPETDLATMATAFEREQIERHFEIDQPAPLADYIDELEALVARMRDAV